MWLMTQHGFFSIVKNSQAPDEYFVRGRVKNDLANLNHLMGWKRKIHTWATADYRYRIIVSQQEMIGLVAQIAEAIDYSNFKGRIHTLPDQDEKSAAYGRVWAVMEALQR